ncbi:MAG TPA: DUF6580 family putative transport protein [Verrucomicrobiae bacterium]|nr:DUF6580 family putative transport protein [Verrucomicrobiae bacterium]
MIYFLAVLTVLIRLLPHAPNFAPLGALALLAGMSGDKRKLWLPLAAVFAADLYLGFYSGFLWVYLSYGLLFFTGYGMRQAAGMKKTIALPLSGSMLFFLVSNFGVWASGSLYPPTASGLAQCFLAALPFFRNTLASDLMYFNAFILLAALFGKVSWAKPAPARA